MNWTVNIKVNFVNSSQNEGLSSSGIALSFVRFGSISWHSVWFSSDGSFSFHMFSSDFQLWLSSRHTYQKIITWVVSHWYQGKYIIIVHIEYLFCRPCFPYTGHVNCCLNSPVEVLYYLSLTHIRETIPGRHHCGLRDAKFRPVVVS
jgi:hypothetical protein